MRKFYLFVSTHRWVFITGTLLFVLLGALLIRFITPNKEVEKKVTVLNEFETTKSIEFSQTLIEKIKGFTPPAIPTALQVFNAQTITLSPQSFLKLFKSSHLVTAGIWTDDGSQKSLAYNPYGKEYIFDDTGFSGDFDAAAIQTINTDQALNVAKTFLEKNIGISGYSPLTNEIIYQKKNDSNDETSRLKNAEEASLATFPFTIMTNGYPFFSEQNVDYPILISVDSDDVITRVKISESLISLKQSKLVQTVPFDEALKKLNLARILRISTNDDLGFNFDSAIKLTIHQATVEYRSSSTNQLVLPWYNVQADALIKDTVSPITIDFLLPAVPLEIQTQQ